MCLHGFSLLITSCCRQGIDHPEAIAVKRKFSLSLMLFCHLPNSNGEIPVAVQTGQIPDISKFMHFHFWQEVLVESHQKDKTEELARWCYPAEVLEMSSPTWFCSRSRNNWCHVAMCDQLLIPSTRIYAKDRTPRRLHLLPHHLKLKLLMKMKTMTKETHLE